MSAISESDIEIENYLKKRHFELQNFMTSKRLKSLKVRALKRDKRTFSLFEIDDPQKFLPHDLKNNMSNSYTIA